MPEIEWRDVQGYEGMYEVSNTGRVRSRKTGHIHELKLKHNQYTGYDYIILHKDNRGITRSVHRLVAVAFVPNPDNLPVVNHIDECKTNNFADNLEWCTQKYNNDYSSYKRRKRVEVLTPEYETVAIFSSEFIAAEFLGVTKGAVCSALRGFNGSCKGFLLRYAGDVQ